MGKGSVTAHVLRPERREFVRDIFGYRSVKLFHYTHIATVVFLDL